VRFFASCQVGESRSSPEKTTRCAVQRWRYWRSAIRFNIRIVVVMVWGKLTDHPAPTSDAIMHCMQGRCEVQDSISPVGLKGRLFQNVSIQCRHIKNDMSEKCECDADVRCNEVTGKSIDLTRKSRGTSPRNSISRLAQANTCRQRLFFRLAICSSYPKILRFRL